MKPRDSKGAAWSRRLASFSAVLFIVAGTAHRLEILETAGFIPVLGIVGLLAILALLLAARGFYRLWHFGDRGGRNLTVGALVALLVLIPFAFMASRAVVHPMLHDISTDVQDLPQFRIAASARQPAYSAEHRKLQLENYPLVTGRRYELQFDRVVTAVAKVLKDRDWRIVSAKDVSQNGETTFEALVYTIFLAFPMDVAIRITDEGASTYVDMRSASRYGAHDFGANAALIKVFLSDLDVEISSLVGVAPAEPAETEVDAVPQAD